MVNSFAEHSGGDSYISTPDSRPAGLSVLDYPPDFSLPDPNISLHPFNEQPENSARIWLPQGSTSGLIRATRDRTKKGHFSDYLSIRMADDISRVHGLLQTSMAPLIEAAGLSTSVYQDPDNENLEHSEITLPSPEQFCANVDEMVEQGLAFIGFGVGDNPGEFSGWEEMKSLAQRKKLLVGRLATQQEIEIRPSLKWRSFETYSHDLFFHALAGLAINAGTADNMFRQARSALRFRYSPLFFYGRMLMSGLANDIEDNLSANRLRLLLKGDPQLEMFPDLKNPKQQQTNATLIRQHLASIN